MRKDHRHQGALSLTTGQAVQHAFAEGCKIEFGQRLGNSGMISFGRSTPVMGVATEGDQLPNGQTRCHLGGLAKDRQSFGEDIMRAYPDFEVIDTNGSDLKLLQTRHQRQQRRLARSVRTDQRSDAPVRDVNGHSVEDTRAIYRKTHVLN